jgi:hypothetical protein
LISLFNWLKNRIEQKKSKNELADMCLKSGITGFHRQNGGTANSVYAFIALDNKKFTRYPFEV